ncbi:MAG: hypothetical protein Q9226_009099, partial [Calogaya cf. arnoldii]
MSISSRKVVITALGDVSNLSIVNTTIPDPPKNDVQVRTFYSGFSGTDINMRLGRYPMQKKAPLTPGYSLVGKVVKNGPACSQFQVGDIVACLTVYDAQSDYANLPQQYLTPVPEGTDLQQATALIADWSTAYGLAINTARVSSGQKVFVHGISGAVGYATMIICQRQGAQVYGTCSEKNFAAIEIFDPLGFESWDESYSILAPTGHLLGYGGNLATLTGQADRSVLWPTIKLLARNLSFYGKKTTFFYITRDSKSF